MARLIVAMNHKMINGYNSGLFEPININTDMCDPDPINEINIAIDQKIKDFEAMLIFSNGTKELVYLKEKTKG